MSKNNLQGNVYIVRHLSDGSTLDLTYRPKDEFDKWVTDGNDKALEHFTLDDSNNLYIANVTTTSIDYTYKGYASGEKETDVKTKVISTVSIPYQEMIRKYTIPFEFLMPLLSITEDAKFCSDIANEILEKTVITLGIYDNVTTVINEYHEVTDLDYEKVYDSYIDYTYKDASGTEIETGIQFNDAYREKESDQKERTEVYTTETTTNIVGLDSAYTIFFDMKQTYVKVDLPDEVTTDGPNKSEESKNDLVQDATSWVNPSVESKIEKEFKEYYKNAFPERTVKKVDVKTTDPGTYYKKYLIKETITSDSTTTIKKMKYEEDSDPANSYIKFKGKDATDGFYQRFIQDDYKTKHTRSCLFEVKDRLFAMLEENLPNPENYINIMKYIFYLFTGVDYGVTDISALLDLYKAENFITLGAGGARGGGAYSGYEQFKRFVRAYESHEGLSADGTKYKVGLVRGNRTVGYGIDLETSGLEPAIKAAAGITGEIKAGDYIDVAIIDQFEDQELKAHIDYIRDKTAGLNLEEYQIYALASRAYNCGDYGATRERNGKTFVQAYSSYWDKSKNAYGETPTGPYNDKLYTDYMCNPGVGDSVLSERRLGEWKLFKYGYYDRLDEYYQGGSTASIEGIDLYNADGSVNKAKIDELNALLTQEVESQSGPYMSNYYTYKQCTWWVQSRASEYLGYPYPVHADSNNGNQWYSNNIKAGKFAYGSEPRANSIISWNNPSSGGYGHVAYVEAVDTVNGIIYISHASSGKSFKGITAIPISGYFDKTYPYGYIYLDSPLK